MEATEELTKSNSNITESEKVLTQYPGLRFIEKLPEVSKLDIRQQGENLKISLLAENSYQLDFELRPPKKGDFNEHSPTLEEQKDKGNLVVEKMSIGNQDITKELKEAGVTLVIDIQTPHLQKLPDEFLSQGEDIYLKRNLFIYLLSEEETVPKTIFMSLPVNEYGLTVLAHEFGHFKNNPVSTEEYDQRVKEIGKDLYSKGIDESRKQEIINRQNAESNTMINKRERAAHSFGITWLRNLRRKIGLQTHDVSSKINNIVNLMLSSYSANKNVSNFPYDKLINEAVNEAEKASV